MRTTVTLDTNTLPLDAWLGLADRARYDFAVVSVTSEEMKGTSFAVHLIPLEQIEKHTAYGLDAYGHGSYGGVIDKKCVKKALSIISGGSFSDADRIVGLS